MESNDMTTDEFSWLAQRRYEARAQGDQQSRTVIVSVGPPRKLASQERPFDSAVNAYGCTVQTGAEFTRRLVCGRDPLEALFHALLSIEMFLISASSNTELVDETGKVFDPSVDGLLSGPIGKEYLRELGARKSG